MSPLLHRLAGLHRPALLIRAARAGQPHYDRDRHLVQILGPQVWQMQAAEPPVSRSAETLQLLIDVEQALEGRRAAGWAYPVRRHVSVLVALVAEIRLWRSNEPPGAKTQTKGVPAA